MPDIYLSIVQLHSMKYRIEKMSDMALVVVGSAWFVYGTGTQQVATLTCCIYPNFGLNFV